MVLKEEEGVILKEVGVGVGVVRLGLRGGRL